MVSAREANSVYGKRVAVYCDGERFQGKAGGIDEVDDEGPEIEYALQLWSEGKLFIQGVCHNEVVWHLKLDEIDRIEILDM